MQFWQELWHEIGITWAQAVGVVISSIVLYFVYALVLRLWGQRLYANRSGTGLAVVMVLGAVGGRSMLGPAPTLAGGLICLAVLLACEYFFGVGRSFVKLGHRRPVVVWVHGEPVVEMLRKYHLSRQMIWTTLRKSGITNVDEVAAVILEPDGSLSTIKAGSPLDPQLLAQIRGTERLRHQAEK